MYPGAFKSFLCLKRRHTSATVLCFALLILAVGASFFSFCYSGNCTEERSSDIRYVSLHDAHVVVDSVLLSSMDDCCKSCKHVLYLRRSNLRRSPQKKNFGRPDHLDKYVKSSSFLGGGIAFFRSLPISTLDFIPNLIIQQLKAVVLQN
mgnify:CR=1 FL=1